MNRYGNTVQQHISTRTTKKGDIEEFIRLQLIMRKLMKNKIEMAKRLINMDDKKKETSLREKQYIKQRSINLS